MAKVAKKPETKTRKQIPVVRKSGSKKYLEKVPAEVVFWCHDGQIFNDLDQLLVGFDLMSDETYSYHVNEDKNDFSCWVLDVIGDGELATGLKKAKTKTEAKKITQQRYYDLTRLEG